MIQSDCSRRTLLIVRVLSASIASCDLILTSQSASSSNIRVVDHFSSTTLSGINGRYDLARVRMSYLRNCTLSKVSIVTCIHIGAARQGWKAYREHGRCVGQILSTTGVGYINLEKRTAFICDLQDPSSPSVRLAPLCPLLVFQCYHYISVVWEGLSKALRTAGQALGAISDPWTPSIHSSSTSVCKAASVSRSRRSLLDGRLMAKIFWN